MVKLVREVVEENVEAEDERIIVSNRRGGGGAVASDWLVGSFLFFLLYFPMPRLQRCEMLEM